MSCSVLNRRRNYMRNPFPMETGFYGLVRNTGCLDKSNLSCSIDLYLHTSSKGPVAYAGDTSHSRVPFEIRVFANTVLPPPFPSATPYLSASLYFSLRFRVPLGPHRVASSSSYLYISIVLLNLPAYLGEAFYPKIHSLTLRLRFLVQVPICQVCEKFPASPPRDSTLSSLFCSRQTMREI